MMNKEIPLLFRMLLRSFMNYSYHTASQALLSSNLCTSLRLSLLAGPNPLTGRVE
jgi:hypothetical protein